MGSRKPLKLIFFNLPILNWIQLEPSRWYRQHYPTWITWKTCLDICGGMGFIITNQIVANDGKLLPNLTMVNWDALPWHLKMAIRKKLFGDSIWKFFDIFLGFCFQKFESFEMICAFWITLPCKKRFFKR